MCRLKQDYRIGRWLRQNETKELHAVYLCFLPENDQRASPEWEIAARSIQLLDLAVSKPAQHLRWNTTLWAHIVDISCRSIRIIWINPEQTSAAKLVDFGLSAYSSFWIFLCLRAGVPLCPTPISLQYHSHHESAACLSPKMDVSCTIQSSCTNITIFT